VLQRGPKTAKQRNIHRLTATPFIREQIKAQLERLIESSRVATQPSEFDAAVQRHLDAEIQKHETEMEGKFVDFEAGIWVPQDNQAGRVNDDEQYDIQLR
jgi:hypothetical protein